MGTKRQEQIHKLSDMARSRLGEAHIYHEPQLHSYGIDPEDGLPRLKVPPMSQTLAPPYSPDNFTCAGDPRLIDEHGNVYDVEHVASDELGFFVEGSTPEGVQTKIRLRVVRPPCKHYHRQLIPFEDSNKKIYAFFECFLRP